MNRVCAWIRKCMYVCVCVWRDLEKECVVIPGVATVCDSEIMVLSRVSVFTCVRSCVYK